MVIDDVAEIGRARHGGTDNSELIDFSANTNPLTPDGVEDAYQATLERARSYPPEPPIHFAEVAAEYVDCHPEQVVPTAGAMEAIRLAIDVIIEPDDSVLLPTPSFSEYEREVRLAQAEPRFVDHDTILDEDPGGCALAILCNPNNPTGDAYSPAEVRTFADRCRDAGTVLLIDEAFLDFTEDPSLAGYPGVIVTRSLTKIFGLPGLRAGFAVATGRQLEALQAVRLPWNVGTPAREVGKHCMQQSAFISDTRQRVVTERTRIREALPEKFHPHPSDAPFLLLRVQNSPVETVVEHAREHGIAVRDATTFRGLDSHIRVAVRLPTENDHLIDVLNDV